MRVNKNQFVMQAVDLKIDRNLLWSNFDGYKLSFDAVPVLKRKLGRSPLKLEPKSDQYSLLHVSVFSMHNYLFTDPWERTNSYYINDAHQIVFCSYDMESRQSHQRIIYNMNRQDSNQSTDGNYNYTMRFISEKYCILCDGIDTLYLLDTGNRMRAIQWQLIASTPINDTNTNTNSNSNSNSNNNGHILYDARLDIVQERKQISIVTGHVARRTCNDTPCTLLLLTWARWMQSVPIGDWTYNICEQLETPGLIYYCAFEPRAESLVICSNKKIIAEHERCAAAVETETEAENTDNVNVDVDEVVDENVSVELRNGHQTQGYRWTQSHNDIEIIFPIRLATCHDDISVDSTNTTLVVSCDEKTLLDGSLFASIDSQLTTWSMDCETGHHLRVTLKKQTPFEWANLLLAHSESENEIENESEPLPIPNLEEPIEDCDLPLVEADDDINMVRYNLATRRITHTIYMGSNPTLFNTILRPGFPAAFVTRQGVDAALWLQVYQPSKPNEWSVRHEGNLHAFAYVQASKENRKFIECSPELDYAVICESDRHLFIYKCRHDMADGLRHRNGPQVRIGKQSIVTFEEKMGEVLGITTAPHVINVLTRNALLHIQV